MLGLLEDACNKMYKAAKEWLKNINTFIIYQSVWDNNNATPEIIFSFIEPKQEILALVKSFSLVAFKYIGNS